MDTDFKGRMTEDERKALREILDRHEITVYTSEQDGELVTEAEFYSGLGEDFIMSFFWDGSPKSFAQGVESYYEDFDPYEHACTYISMSYSERERLRVPASNEALMKDALKIKKKISKFLRDLNKRFNDHYTKGA